MSMEITSLETETRRPPFSKHSTDSSAPINSSTSDYTMTTSLNGSADCLPLPDQAESSAAAAEPPPQPFAGGSTATQHLPTMPVTRPLSPTCTSVTTETSESVRDGERGPASDSGSGTGSGSTSELESMAELEVIIEALKSKDRLFVLKLGEQMDGLIRDRGNRTKFDSTPQSAYQKMLVFRCATYYKLNPKVQPSPSQTISLHIAVESRIPSRRISELVPPEETAHPMFKIMRRSEQDRKKSKTTFSQPGSVAGEDGELSDIDPSETGSMGSRSTTSKKRMTMEEREARYQEARSRIFMDFAGKEKSKERDPSASSSTLSLASGHASTGGGENGGGGVDDVDDSVSNAATDSDWIDRRRPVVAHTSSSSRASTYRSNPSSYDGYVNPMNGQPPNPQQTGVTYPSIYDPASGAHVSYDASQQYMHPPPPPGGYMVPYAMYPYPPPGPGQPYGQPPYPYYGYPPQPHHPLHTSSDPSSPVASPVDAYNHPPPGQHGNPYMWGYPPPPPSGHTAAAQQHGPGSVDVYAPVAQRGPPVPHPVAGHGHSHSVPPPPPPHQQLPPQAYPPYGPGIPYGQVPGPQYGYNPHPQQYYPPPQQAPAPYHGEHPLPSGSVSEASTSSSSGGHSPTYSRNGHGTHFPVGNHNNGNNNNNGRRGAPPARAAWSYGPGVSMGGMPSASGPGPGYGQNMGSTSVGPRLGGMNRKTSSSSGGGNGNKMPADDASTASSSASSSSSRRTYTSTSTPPKHPLPARPDWAAGMKAHPTLATPGRKPHGDSNNSSRNMSPAKVPLHLAGSHPQQMSSPSSILQPNDFPPLTMASTAHERRPPAAGGAWSSNQTRTIVASSQPVPTNQGQGVSTYATALFNHGMVNGAHQQTPTIGNATHNRLDDDDRGFERPPPKSNAELFNPKSGDIKRSGSSGSSEKEKERVRGSSVIADAILVDKFSSAMNIQRDGQGSNSPKSGDEREQLNVAGVVSAALVYSQADGPVKEPAEASS